MVKICQLRPGGGIAPVHEYSSFNKAREMLCCYQQLYDYTRDIILFIRMDGRIIEANRAAVQMYGYTRRELLSMSIYSLRYGSTSTTIKEQMELANKGGIIFETVHRRRDGTIFPVEVNSRGATLKGHRVLLSVVRDITRRRMAEEEMHNTYRQLQDIIDFLPDATFVIDRDKRVIAWNRAIEEMTGYCKESVMGKGNFAYAVPFYGEPRPIIIDLIGCGNLDMNSHYDYIKKQGETLYAEVFVPSVYAGKGAFLWIKASPLYDRRGNLAGAIESIRDITERKRTELELLEATKKANRAERLASLGTMSAGIAHEINQPLNAINILADGIIYWHETGKPLGIDEVIKDIREISHQVKRIDDVIRRMHSFVSNKSNLQPEPCNLNSAVNRALDMLRHQISTKGIRIKKNLQDPLPLLLGEECRLEEMVINLLVNAIQALDSVDRDVKIVMVSTYYEDKVVMEVADNGPGIGEDIKDKIYDPFFSTKIVGDGMGLGLSIVHSVVTAFNGEIVLLDNKAGGVTFKVIIPSCNDFLSKES